MKKYSISIIALLTTITLISCEAGKKGKIDSIAKTWCELNRDISNAPDLNALQKAMDVRKEFEQRINEEYKTDTVSLNAIKQAALACYGIQKKEDTK